MEVGTVWEISLLGFVILEQFYIIPIMYYFKFIKIIILAIRYIRWKTGKRYWIFISFRVIRYVTFLYFIYFCLLNYIYLCLL